MAKETYHVITALAIASLACMVVPIQAAQPAWAQRQSNPNMKNFYMARQQIQITDDAPLINDLRTIPGQTQPGQGGGGMPRGPVGLPRAGFQQYSTSMPTFNTSLPKVVNGVPSREPPPPPVKQGKKGKAGKLKVPTKSATSKPAAPLTTSAKAYSPYKSYNPQTAMDGGATSPTAASGMSNLRTNTRVKGSVLHWARGR